MNSRALDAVPVVDTAVSRLFVNVELSKNIAQFLLQKVVTAVPRKIQLNTLIRRFMTATQIESCIVINLVKVVVDINGAGAEVTPEQGGMCREHRRDVEVSRP